MLVDLNHRSGFVYRRAADAPPPLGARINTLLDDALVAERAGQRPRDYLGASRIGEPCARRLVYEVTHTPPDPGKELEGRSLRIFAAGHVFEDLAIRWLRLAGFDLRTQTREGGQFGFETAGGRIRGHVDGVIVAGPEVGLAWPVLWEHKALKASSWSDTAKKGVRLSKPVYFGQMQIYMAYLGLGSALFTALNKDSCELYHEHVPFDPATAQELSDKAVAVLRAADAGELLPRIATSPDFYLCRFCPFSARCWGEPRPGNAPVGRFSGERPEAKA
ncbi:PD-(D/E)XK nuclease family protein [Tropicimonas isoalkanivorans]|uniref:Uncharacterized protein n=1 Tax=Tropicimonas isoalkanivorans TaxID=441112 RepID=A0A1I1MYX0_9RHOB|nr:PD-(D/E)XK nuclease family protein [Tropicimonas isoalkanivorans]SFC90375.1 hypothetical protein SAMN04488094_11137 [Tropicimonas isoalkanivorans]